MNQFVGQEQRFGHIKQTQEAKVGWNELRD